MKPPRTAALTRAILLLALAGIGFGIGWYLPFSSGSNERKVSQVPLHGAVEGSAPRETVERSAPSSIEDVKAVSTVPALDEDVDLSRLLRQVEAKRQRVLPRRSILEGFTGRMINPGGTVSEEAAELLQLTEAEVSGANRAIRHARDQLQELESERTQVVPLSPTEVAFQIAAFPAEGDAVKEEFHTRMLAAMGDDAGEMFWETMNRPASLDSLGGFGEEAKELYFGLRPIVSATPQHEAFPVMAIAFGIGPAGSFTTPKVGAAMLHSRVHEVNYSPASFERLAGRHGYLSGSLEEYIKDPFSTKSDPPK